MPSNSYQDYDEFSAFTGSEPQGHAKQSESDAGSSSLPSKQQQQITPVAPLINNKFSVHNLKLVSLPSMVREVAAHIPFRSSIISDYHTCPQMMMYRWLFGFDEEESFFSGVMGTAGHEVIYNIHNQRMFDVGYDRLLKQFNEAFEKEIAGDKVLPKVAAKFDTLIEQRDAMSPEYIEMLVGYINHQKNRKFYSTMHEQRFVLMIDTGETLPRKDRNPDSDWDEIGNLKDLVPVQQDPHPYLFTGTIDQAGYYEDGSFSLRDLKFRMEAFRPSHVELSLNLQITIYAYALRFGQPSCDDCQPYYNEAENTFAYNGPCTRCAAKIGTHQWPNKYPETCEMIWMRDFLQTKKDEYTQFVVDKTRKVAKAGSKRMVYPKITNPKWLTGKKKGDLKGPAFMATARAPAQLEIFMGDILKTCHDIRQGVFYRRPGNTCNFWCKHRESCLNALELTVDQANVGPGSNFMTLDPFAETS